MKKILNGIRYPSIREMRRRRFEWGGMPIFPSRASCLDPMCSARGDHCRETPEGIYCCYHYVRLPVCERCGSPGTVAMLRENGAKRRAALCRVCYCGPITAEYLALQRQAMISVRSALGAVAEIMDEVPVLMVRSQPEVN